MYRALSQGLKKEAWLNATKSAFISCLTTFAIVLGIAGVSIMGQSLSVGFFGVWEIIVPVASWIQVEEVDVRMRVQPLLQYSAAPTSDLFKILSGKIWATGDTIGVGSLPVAIEAMTSPLGSPTLSPPPG